MRIYFCLRMWGQVYTDFWLKFGLPSQMSAGNLPYAAAHAQCKYLILTNAEDMPAIQRTPICKALSELMSLGVQAIPENVRQKEKYDLMSWCDRTFLDFGTRDSAVLVVLAPDAVYSNSSFTAMCQALAAGKKAVLVGCSLRALNETFLPAVSDLLAGRPAGAGLGSRELVSLCLRHLHPANEVFFWDTREPLNFPAGTYWRVGASGILCRAYRFLPLALDLSTPFRCLSDYMDEDWTLTVSPAPRDMHLVTDSDELFIAEFAERSYTLERGTGPARPRDVDWIGAQAREIYNIHHFHFFRQNIRIHAGELPAEWEAVEGQANRICEDVLAQVRTLSAVEAPPPAPPAVDSQGFQALRALAQAYASDFEAPGAATTLRAARQRYAQMRLSAPLTLPDESIGPELCALHSLLLLSGLQDEPLDAAEQRTVQEILSRAQTAQDTKIFLRALEPFMLYVRPHRHESRLPRHCMMFNWLDGYWEYLVSAPPLFQQEGEALQFLAHYQHHVPLIADFLHVRPGHPFKRRAATAFLYHASFLPLYPTDAPLDDLASQRAMILECVLLGYPLEAPLAPRPAPAGGTPALPAGRAKIRLGVLCERFGAQFETCAALPAFERLDREKFEILLFALHSDGDAAEACCRDRADRLALLPATLFEQVQALRDADLDVLLIGSNAAGANDRIALLALHRLARVQWLTAATPIASGMRHCTGRISGTLTEGPGCTAGVPPAGAKLAEREEESGRDARGTLVLLNGPAHCFSFAPDSQPAGKPIDRAMLRVAPEAALYVSAVPLNMLTFEMRRTWARILAAVPGSALALALTEECRATPAVVRRFSGLLDSTLRACGVDEQRCIVLSGQLAGLAEKRQFLRLGDVYLDAYPFTSVAAAALALECGVPTVAWEGSEFRSRMTAGLLRDLQLQDLIASSENGYVEIAARLGADRALRLRKREELAGKLARKPRFLDSAWYGRELGARIMEQFR